MEPSQLSRNLSTAVSVTTKLNLDYCYPTSNVDFESVNAALNVVLAIVTTFANILVFAAVQRSTSIRLPSKLLLCSMVLTDLGVGLVVQPLFVTFIIARATDSSANCFIRTLCVFAGVVLTCVSLLTMTAISLDRYIAFFFHLKYREIVTARRVCMVLVIIWSNAVILAWMWIHNGRLSGFFFISGFVVCFLVISLSYIKIFRGLRHRHHGRRVQDQAPETQAQQRAGNTLDIAKYRRSASSMLWIYGLFILCYLPSFCVGVVIISTPHTDFIACMIEFASTLVMLNSCLNPFVYCFRLPEIRVGVLQIIQKIRGQSSEQ